MSTAVRAPVDPRGHVEHVHAPEIRWSELPAKGWPAGARCKVFSRNPQTGAFSGLLRLPAGYRRPEGHLAADTEYLVLAGWLWVGGELRTYGYYDWAPAGTTLEPLLAVEDTDILFLPRTGAPDFVLGSGPKGEEGRLRINTEEMPWVRAQTKDAPEYGRSKYLRRNPETGEMSALVWAPPGVAHPKIEFHDTVEEMFQIVGDIHLRNSGQMRKWSYFWRPPYITHGPFRTELGGIMYLYTDGKLVNFFTDDPEQSPEENVRQAERERRAAG